MGAFKTATRSPIVVMQAQSDAAGVVVQARGTDTGTCSSQSDAAGVVVQAEEPSVQCGEKDSQMSDDKVHAFVRFDIRLHSDREGKCGERK